MKEEVVIVGAGPAGLATAACLKARSIPSIILEKECCHAHLWKRRTYDRLKLHLAKEFCALPYMPHPASSPTYISKDDFVRYLDGYAAAFGLSPVCNSPVVSASYDEGSRGWVVEARDRATGERTEYAARFLVVATGENAEGWVPEEEDIPGLKSFDGEVIHSCRYKSGVGYGGKRVLVVGCGNSGMEIAYDLCNFGAKTSIVIRSPLHVMTKEMIHLGMVLAKHLPTKLVDALLLILSWFHFGSLTRYGIVRPSLGPISLKEACGRAPVLDVGTIGKIKTGEIQVVKEVVKVNGAEVRFKDGTTRPFDAIIFATGYTSTANAWLKDEGRTLNQDGFPRKRFPNHWKGENGVYCAGFSRRGLAGISVDARCIAEDIERVVGNSKEPRISRICTHLVCDASSGDKYE